MVKRRRKRWERPREQAGRAPDGAPVPTVPDGWTPEAWCRELRRRAYEASKSGLGQRLDVAEEFRKWADEIEKD